MLPDDLELWYPLKIKYIIGMMSQNSFIVKVSQWPWPVTLIRTWPYNKRVNSIHALLKTTFIIINLWSLTSDLEGQMLGMLDLVCRIWWTFGIVLSDFKTQEKVLYTSISASGKGCVSGIKNDVHNLQVQWSAILMEILSAYIALDLVWCEKFSTLQIFLLVNNEVGFSCVQLRAWLHYTCNRDFFVNQFTYHFKTIFVCG